MATTTGDLHADDGDRTEFRLPDETSIGSVTLRISDIEQSLAFYRDLLGLAELGREGSRVSLGAATDLRPIVTLEERRGIRRAARRFGLFHYAILLPGRSALGAIAQRLIDARALSGASDHYVSEALYLADPDGLGIEIYADRPRSTWRFDPDGQLAMGTAALDMHDLLRAGRDTGWSGMPDGTIIGHVHLHVGDIRRASEFYHRALGLDEVVRTYPGALFLSAGGYHHHLGVNIWAGATAGSPDEDEAQLVEWELRVPSSEDIDAIATSLAAHGVTVERSGATLRTRDPWGTRLRVSAVD